jgi:hypothetical protein
MNNDRINEILTFLSGPKCIQYILLGILIVGFCIFFWFGPTSSFLPLNTENV